MLLVADFETTTNADDCRVWAWACCEIGAEQLKSCGNSMGSFIEYIQTENMTLYFHNVGFDGEFIIHFLLAAGFKWTKERKLNVGEFSTLINDTGQFYCMEIKFLHNRVKILDSLKIFPNFSVDKLSKAFGIPFSKLEIDYNEERPVGHVLTQKEIEYITNDVVIVGKALQFMFNQNLDKMTLGGNALKNYKESIGKKNFDYWFPPPVYDEDLRPAYKGGFTFLKKGKSNVDVEQGIVLDVNSLYPWVMYECLLPYYEGIYFEGKYKKDNKCPLYVQTLTCQFEVKEGFLPTLQIKGNRNYTETEYLETSGDDEVTLSLTSVDLALFFDHYHVHNITWHSGWKFQGATGLFKDYIDYWIGIKIEATKSKNSALRTLAKLMLNSLYGKFALNPNVTQKFPYLDKDTGRVRYAKCDPETRTPVYLPMGEFITAYARNKTIRSAQKVYDRFIYADTDSLHLEGLDIPEGLEISDTALGAWKIEGTFEKARFLHQKCYMEFIHTTEKDREKEIADIPENAMFYTEINRKLVRQHITVAGMPDKCYKGVTWDNFKPGSSYVGKLVPTHVNGGIVLKGIDYTISL